MIQESVTQLTGNQKIGKLSGNQKNRSTFWKSEKKVKLFGNLFPNNFVTNFFK